MLTAAAWRSGWARSERPPPPWGPGSWGTEAGARGQQAVAHLAAAETGLQQASRARRGLGWQRLWGMEAGGPAGPGSQVQRLEPDQASGPCRAGVAEEARMAPAVEGRPARLAPRGVEMAGCPWAPSVGRPPPGTLGELGAGLGAGPPQGGETGQPHPAGPWPAAGWQLARLARWCGRARPEVPQGGGAA